MRASSPGQWEEVRMKYLFKAKIAGAWGDEPEDENATVCIRAADFDTDSLSHRKTGLTKRRYEKSEIERKRLLPGDLIIEKSGGGDNQPVGRVIVFELPEEALCSNFLEILRPITHRLNHRFGAYLMYLLWSTRAVIPFIKQTTGIQNLDGEAYLNVKVRIPAFKTQLAIADYVDRETTRLDAMVEAKERLLELLAEKRRGLITRAIKCGLNLNVPFRDSGISWLGQIPAHWAIMKLKHVAFLKSGDAITSDSITESGEYPVYGGNGIRGYTSSFTHNGDYVLIGRQGALCGNINIASGRFWASEHAVVVHVQGENDFNWLGELLQIMNLNQYSQSAAQPGLAVGFVANLQVPIPPLPEQRLIVAHIRRETAKVDTLKVAAERTIELLKERRIALIAAAVTGQIGVN